MAGQATQSAMEKEIKKILIVFGTRPEAIKMAPLVKVLEKYTHIFDFKVCITAQHREMLDQVLEFFGITPDYDLNIMRPGQNLTDLTADILCRMRDVLSDYAPHYVFVHGDTTTSMAAALAAFYHGTKVCHVEAGLRTYNKHSPFPEELNRQLTGRIADYHFAPTEASRKNLLAEGIAAENILVTGNTVVDALLMATSRLHDYSSAEIDNLHTKLHPEKKIILVTGHRRENHGEGLRQVGRALQRIVTEFNDVQVVYPVHPNPNVRASIQAVLGNQESILLTEPLSYPAFIWMMKRAALILTDSGGIQEEAPSLGKPVLLLRDTTERPEAIDAGTVLKVGTDEDTIVEAAARLLTDSSYYQLMSRRNNPYGDGQACERIVNFLLDKQTTDEKE